ncbi:Uncharacterized damage-inducible protein DinB (forms a four-helix bundle) [Fictibacillus solisalsi]|uniref:Uncharacterized damage-inducible protein DinB (Forms a four-helix bundle) n=1 Tax=Fictibacillus solisalsi TaxID=459525 RepID=A0A1G9TYP3_9BACL|nr:DinB family protein [Fictibacillus solisalsi]SDM52748.1 Uncharacterized damage-inducible protein DinB (forms a four-helix bundle) [Fictibacillus solisalsi]
MKILFQYNWQVREDWYSWCEDVPLEELLKERTGGVGGILHTLFHIADVEWSWIRGMQGKPDFQESFDGYRSLEKVRMLDAKFKPEVQTFVNAWNDSMEHQIMEEHGSVRFTHGEIMRHMIAHEIHHIGQLSVWAREIGREPVTANLIRRGLGVNVG